MANNKNRGSKNRRSTRKQRPSSGGAPAAPVVHYYTPFAPKVTRLLRYTEVINLVEGAAQGGAFYVYTPSSLYDPNNSGGGHQPMYFDQLCTSLGPYLKYRALSTVAKLHFVNTSNTVVWTGAFVSPSLTTPASTSQFYEKPGASVFALQGAGGYQSQKTLTIKIDHAKAMGISKQHLLNDDYFAGNYGSSPTSNFGLILGLFGTGGSAQSTQVMVELFITAQFYSLGNASTS